MPNAGSIRTLTLAVLGALIVSGAGGAEDAPGWAEIRVVDAESGRGIPLVELETLNGLRFVTDNAGRIAFCEPGLMGREIYFHAQSHGYEAPKDGFGYAGFRITPRAGEVAEVAMTRRMPAERLCRLTGEGRYRDTLLLGHAPPLPGPANPGLVMGQDSVQATVHRDRVYWFWGDTQRFGYPQGLFRMAGATTPIPDPTDPASDPAPGIPFDYFVDDTGFARAMMPLPERPEGVIWVGAVFTVPDASGRERLVGHYSRRKGLAEEYEQGIAVYDDDRDIFESAAQLPLDETWRRPSGHPIRMEEDGEARFLFGSPSPNVRVRATLEAVLDPARYEAFTCAREDDPEQPLLDADGKPVWRWQRDAPPTGSQQERGWIDAGLFDPADARFCPADAESPEEGITLHSGTVRWNAYRERWVLVAGQIGGEPSLLGEVWYAEADAPTGPFTKAVRVVTHEQQTFYNVCHHAFLDREDGRLIHFEGTYTNDFSGNPHKTPRYNYNQVLYRLDLARPELEAARGG